MNKEIPIQNPFPEAKIAIQAALEAGKVVMKVYNQKFTSTTKNDNEPITEADIKSNELIQKTISSCGYPILSEESIDDKKRLDFNRIWIIDPLDGTSDFIKKTGEFTIMISLLDGKHPILGIIYWPTKDKLFFAQKDNGAYKLDDGIWSKLSVSNISELSECKVVGSRYHISTNEKKFLELLKTSNFISKGSSLKVADISSGLAELYFTTTDKIKQWDTCASYCLIHEAGGKMSDMYGNDLEYNTEKLNHENGLLVSNGLIHDKIIKLYKNFLEDR